MAGARRRGLRAEETAARCRGVHRTPGPPRRPIESSRSETHMAIQEPPAQVNLIGLTKNDYKGAPSTLCKGCGHDSISARIISVAYDLALDPTQVIKMSGIGCSSKTPAYFLGQSHGFNSLHGRM